MTSVGLQHRPGTVVNTSEIPPTAVLLASDNVQVVADLPDGARWNVPDQYKVDDVVYDARTVDVLHDATDEDGGAYSVITGGNRFRQAWIGGLFRGINPADVVEPIPPDYTDVDLNDDAWTRRTWKHDHDGTPLALTSREWTVIDGLCAYNVQDGVRPLVERVDKVLVDGHLVNGRRVPAKFRLSDLWLKNCHDDGIQNDTKIPGLIENCFLDGVFTAYSEDDAGTPVNSPNDTVEFDHCIVRLGLLPERRPGQTGGGARPITDVVLEDGSNLITSTSADWRGVEIGAELVGTGIPDGTTIIAAVRNNPIAIMSAEATEPVSGGTAWLVNAAAVEPGSLWPSTTAHNANGHSIPWKDNTSDGLHLERNMKRIVRDCIFVMPRTPVTALESLEWMPVPNALYENVTLIWQGDVAYPGDLPDGVTLSTDIGDYHLAVVEWKLAHGLAENAVITQMPKPTKFIRPDPWDLPT